MQLSLCDGEAVVQLSGRFDDAGSCMTWPIKFEWVGPDFRFKRIERGRETEVRLLRVGDEEAPSMVSVQPCGERLVISTGVVGVNAWIEMTEDGPRLMRQLGGPGAPRRWVWEVRSPKDAPPLQLVSRGRDNVFGYVERPSKRDESRLLDVYSSVTTREDGRNRVAVVEELWSGKVFARDAETRLPILTDDVSYPVYFDPTFGPTQITANEHDGSEWSGAWSFNIVSCYIGTANGGSNGGFRWTNVTVPQGATIDSATLTVYLLERYGTTSVKFYGEDQDNAAAFANSSGNKPSDRTKTTASVTFAPPGAGSRTIDVTAIVQEIVDRPGWVSGNAINFLGMNAGVSWMRIQGWYGASPSANRASLEIAYTEAAANPVITSATITGTSQVGQTLTAVVVTDQDADPAPTKTYQWEVAEDNTGTGATNLGTSSTQALTYANLGDYLDDEAWVRYTAEATKNSLTSDPESSAWQQVTIPAGGGGGASNLTRSPFIVG